MERGEGCCIKRREHGWPSRGLLPIRVFSINFQCVRRVPRSREPQIDCDFNSKAFRAASPHFPVLSGGYFERRRLCDFSHDRGCWFSNYTSFFFRSPPFATSCCNPSASFLSSHRPGCRVRLVVASPADHKLRERVERQLGWLAAQDVGHGHLRVKE